MEGELRQDPGRIRPELMRPILAFRIQKRTYGGLSPETKNRLRQVMGSLEPKRRSHNEARNRFKAGTRLVREWWERHTRSSSRMTATTTSAKSTRAFHRSPARSTERTGQGRPSSVPGRKSPKSESNPPNNSLSCLYPQVFRRGSRTVIQFTTCPAGGLRSVCLEPAARRLAVVSGKIRRRRILRRQYGEPGLKKLLDDIASKKVDTVVVYKVDRLTRALSDFARIVETFDKQGVSFVSVTQQFNTTTSMGRLTLNVLLSFAQFEREVTGERIRDKVAASKKKGIVDGRNCAPWI